jgi:hypothetical protein
VEPQAFDELSTYSQAVGPYTTCALMDTVTSLCVGCPVGSFLNEFNSCEYCVFNCMQCNAR